MHGLYIKRRNKVLTRRGRILNEGAGYADARGVAAKLAVLRSGNGAVKGV